MSTNKRILVIGLGLIGGSIALGIKKQQPTATIIGLDKAMDSLIQGKKLGVIDEIGASFEAEMKTADVVFFCTPVSQTRKMLQNLDAESLKEDVLLTDVGSTKQEIMNAAQPLIDQGVSFIGGHPMAGSHKSGVLAADIDLFENAYYLLTITDQTNPRRVTELQELLTETRAKFLVVTPKEHDQMTGILSHLPHIIASGLVNQTDDFMVEHPNAKRLAAGGFRDITRIASSDPNMWTDILASNREVLISHLDGWQSQMRQVRDWLAEDNQPAIFEFFAEAKVTRDALPVHKEGAIPAFYDLFVDVPDYPGVIAEVTAYLAQEEISLINLKILETREDIFGILQLTFKNQKELYRARACIEKNSDYLCYEK